MQKRKNAFFASLLIALSPSAAVESAKWQTEDDEKRKITRRTHKEPKNSSHNFMASCVFVPTNSICLRFFRLNNWKKYRPKHALITVTISDNYFLFKTIIGRSKNSIHSFRLFFFTIHCRTIIVNGLVSIGLLGAVATCWSTVSRRKSGCECVFRTSKRRRSLFDNIGIATIVCNTGSRAKSTTKNRFR